MTLTPGELLSSSAQRDWMNQDPDALKKESCLNKVKVQGYKTFLSVIYAK